MTSVMTAPRPNMTGPKPLKWTCAEFHRFGDLGLFAGRGAMLIDGIVYEEGPMNPPHALVCELVLAVLASIFGFGTGWRIRSKLPLVLGQDLDPVPDFAVVAGSPRGTTTHPTTAELVVEVSDTSLTFDTTEKRLIYARANIREYWVVDINQRRLLVYRDPQNGDYSTNLTLTANDTVTPLAATMAIRVGDMLV